MLYESYFNVLLWYIYLLLTILFTKNQCSTQITGAFSKKKTIAMIWQLSTNRNTWIYCNMHKRCLRVKRGYKIFWAKHRKWENRSQLKAWNYENVVFKSTKEHFYYKVVGIPSSLRKITVSTENLSSCSIKLYKVENLLFIWHWHFLS